MCREWKGRHEARWPGSKVPAPHLVLGVCTAEMRLGLPGGSTPSGQPALCWGLARMQQLRENELQLAWPLPAEGTARPASCRPGWQPWGGHRSPPVSSPRWLLFLEPNLHRQDARFQGCGVGCGTGCGSSTGSLAGGEPLLRRAQPGQEFSRLARVHCQAPLPLLLPTTCLPCGPLSP